MRVAAVLGICAEALSRYILRFNYLLDGDQLHEFIDSLQDQNWDQGAYVRSVLLRSQPDVQTNNSIKRAEMLVAEVLELTNQILPDERQLKFGDSLLKISRHIAEQWMRLQKLEAVVEPDFSLTDDGDEWISFPLDQPVPFKAESKLNMTDTNFVVWPAFFIFKEGEVEILQQGFALSEEQMKSAKDEESALVSRRARQAVRNSTRRRNKLPATVRNGVLNLMR